MMQILLNSIISGLLLVLVSLGFNLIFTATRIFHLAHGALYVLGVYMYYFLSVSNSLPAYLSLPISVGVVAISGYLIEITTYRPLMHKAKSQDIAFISSMAVFLIGVNCIALVAGNETKMITHSINKTFTYNQIIITHPQLLQIVISVPVIGLLLLFLLRTNLGLKIRAVADNPTLAAVTGIQIKRVRTTVFVIGSVLAAIAGYLKAYDTGIDPYSGMTITLVAAVAVFIGGNSSLTGTVVASFLLSILQGFVEYFLTSQWSNPVTFAILIIILLWRTEGIVQFNVRADER